MSRVRDPYARFCERDKYGMIFYIYYYSIFTLLDYNDVDNEANNKKKKGGETALKLIIAR